MAHKESFADTIAEILIIDIDHRPHRAEACWHCIDDEIAEVSPYAKSRVGGNRARNAFCRRPYKLLRGRVLLLNGQFAQAVRYGIRTGGDAKHQRRRSKWRENHLLSLCSTG